MSASCANTNSNSHNGCIPKLKAVRQKCYKRYEWREMNGNRELQTNRPKCSFAFYNEICTGIGDVKIFLQVSHTLVSQRSILGCIQYLLWSSDSLFGAPLAWIPSITRIAPIFRMLLYAPILQEKGFDSKLSGNEVYYTNSLTLPVKILLSSQHHCQMLFNSNLFSWNLRQHLQHFQFNLGRYAMLARYLSLPTLKTRMKILS